MKKFAIIALASIALLACNSKCKDCEKAKQAPAKVEVTKASLKTQMEKLNYTQGLEIGRSIKRNGLEYNEAIFTKGLLDGMGSVEEGLLTQDEQLAVKREQSKLMMEARRKEREEAGAKNKAEGDKFLAENKAREGVVTTASGLQYQIMKKGDGPMPKETDTVTVHYKGTLIDGTEFDSSYKRNSPATFAVNRVVKGWTEALQLMPKGSKWKLVIPSELAYGERGAGRQIGANAVLVFEVELIEIGAADNAAAPTPKVAPKTITAKPQ